MADYRAEVRSLDAIVEYHQNGSQPARAGEASRVLTGGGSTNFETRSEGAALHLIGCLDSS
jgi:hypothetical protein